MKMTDKLPELLHNLSADLVTLL